MTSTNFTIRSLALQAQSSVQESHKTSLQALEADAKMAIVEAFHEKYIANITDSILPPIKQLAVEFGMQEEQLKRLYKTRYGTPFYQAYMNKKMERALKLLLEGHKCQEVSRMIGYGEISAIKFNKMFQKHFGITPKKFQMLNLKKKES
ncbi:MAG: helix-turn-helix transcriptional regulator [Runella sp.]